MRILNQFRLALLGVIMSIFVDPLYAVMKSAMATCTRANRPPLARLIKFSQHPFVKRGHGKLLMGGRSPLLSYAVVGACVMLLVFAVASTATAHGLPDVSMAILPGAMGVKETQLGKLLTELEAGQDEMKKGPLSQTRGEELQAKAKEAEALQNEIDEFKGRENLIKRGREVSEQILPTGPEQKNTDVAGYVSMGDFVLASAEFKQFVKERYPRSGTVIQIDGAAIHGKNALLGPRGEPMVPLNREQAKAFQEFIESKVVPTIGTGVVPVDRLARVPQVTVDDQLTMRDVIAVGQTGAGSVEYVREESHTQAAAETAHGSSKPEEALEYTLQTAAVRTIAAWMPVQNQQLEDWAQLRSLMEGRLRYSVKRREEYQLAWGNGTAPNIEGIFDVAGTIDIGANGRYDSGDHTLIDVVRMGITDVRVAGYNPNFVTAHPYDWESIVLEKGTDDRYVWAVVTDANGSRMWGLRVVETVAMAKRAGYATEERRILVGDGQMGAQILDRMQIDVTVGLVNDQFIKNMRTILVEERLAFPIYAPEAFAWHRTETQAT